MNRKIQLLRLKEADLYAQYVQAENELKAAIRDCTHQWGPTIADHIYHKGYTIPGDPHGTMGVDWRGPTYVEAKTEKRWKRVCQICGEEEVTTRTRQIVNEEPEF